MEFVPFQGLCIVKTVGEVGLQLHGKLIKGDFVLIPTGEQVILVLFLVGFLGLGFFLERLEILRRRSVNDLVVVVLRDVGEVWLWDCVLQIGAHLVFFGIESILHFIDFNYLI